MFYSRYQRTQTQVSGLLFFSLEISSIYCDLFFVLVFETVQVASYKPNSYRNLFIQGARNVEIQVFTVVQAQVYMPSLSYRSYRKLWLWSSN